MSRGTDLHQMKYDFSGGLNVDSSREHLLPNELRVANNVDYAKRGGVRSRKGFSKFNSVSYDGEITQIIEWVRNDGTKYLLAVIDEALYQLETDSKTLLQELNSEKIGYFFLRDQLFFVDGDEYYVYDGSLLQPVIPYDPTEAIAEDFFYNEGAGEDDWEPGYTRSQGTLSKEEDHLLIKCEENVYEGDDVSYQTYRTANKVNLTDIKYLKIDWKQVWNLLDPPQYYVGARSHFYVGTQTYFMASDAEHAGLPFVTRTGVFEAVDQLDVSNLTGEYYILVQGYGGGDAPDAILTEIEVYKVWGEDYDEEEEPEIPVNDLEPVRRCKYALWHTKGMRAFFAGDYEDGSALYYSERGQENYVREVNVVYPNSAEGPITGLALLMDAIMVFYKYSIWVWRGLDPETDAIWEKLPTSEGSLSNEAVALTTNSITFLGPGGIYTATPDIIGIPMNLQAGKDFILNVTQSKVKSLIEEIENPEEAVAIFDRKKELYILAYSSPGAEYNDKVLTLDWSSGSYSEWTLPKANDLFQRIDGTVMFASEDYIYILDKSADDDGTPIELKIKTPHYFFDAPFHRKQMKRYFISLSRPEPTVGDITVTVKLFIDGEEIQSNDIVLGPSDDLIIRRITNREKGKRFALQIECSAEDIVEIYGIAFEYSITQTEGEEV